MRFGGGALATLLALGACGEGVADRQPMAGADPGRGREIIARLGCASCHVIPGVEWPKGRVGPSLQGFASRSLIAGLYANEPDILVEFVRNAPAYAPAAGMPPMPLTEPEARDVAAYLYTLR